MDSLSIKQFLATAASIVSMFLQSMMGVDFWTFGACLCGATFAVAMQPRMPWLQTVSTIIIGGILAGWVGAVLIQHFPKYAPPAIGGLVAFGLVYFRKTIQSAMREWIKNKGKGDRYGGYNDYHDDERW